MYVQYRPRVQGAVAPHAIGHVVDRLAVKEVTASADRDPSESGRDFARSAQSHANARLSIEHDDVVGSYIYKIIDSDSGEVMRQFPHEQVLEVMRFFGQKTGVVFDRRV